MDKIKDVAQRLGIITVEDMERYTALELMMKIANKVNEMVNEVGRFETDVQDVVNTQNENIQYLLDEGLYLEVENIFDEWIEDGTFDLLIKGHTVEVTERVAKEEIARQIEDGTIANLKIEDNSITSQKLKDNSINYQKFDNIPFADKFKQTASSLKNNELLNHISATFNGNKTQVIEDGWYVFKSNGESGGAIITIDIPIKNPIVGEEVVIEMTTKRGGANHATLAGFIKVFTSKIDEYTLNYGDFRNPSVIRYSLTLPANITKIQYVVSGLGISDNVDFYFKDVLIYYKNKSTVEVIETIISDVDLLKLSNDTYTINTLEVSPSFNTSTSGFGVSKFNSLITAHEYTNGKSNINNRYLIKVHPGTYNDWGTVFAGSDVETAENYIGIRVNDYVYFESTDINHPENYILEWDGHSGFSNGYTMNRTQAMRRCLFHLDKRPLHTHIKGFTLKAKNTRYCIHPETAGVGWGNEWLIENCIFDWGGCPNVTGYSGATVGIGISSGEKGHIKNCKWKNTGYAGIVGHNNGFTENQWNAKKPFFVEGGNLLIENCDLNGCSITQDTLKDDIDGFDLLTIKNCRNIKSIATGLQGTAVQQNWKVDVIQSEVIEN